MTVFDRFVLGLGYGATALGIILIVSAFFVFLCSLAAVLGKAFGENEDEDEEERKRWRKAWEDAEKWKKEHPEEGENE